MIADHVATAQAREADIATLALTGDTVARPLGDIVEIDAAPLGGGPAHADGGAGRCIDLVLVMHLEDLDIEIVVQGGRDLLGQRKQQVHGQAHIRRVHDDRLLAGGFQRRFLGSFHAGGANNVGDARVGGQCHVVDRRPRQGEFDDGVRRGNDGCGIIGDGDTKRAGTGGIARVLSDQGRARDVRGGGDCAAIRVRDLADAGLSHAPAGADDSDHHVGHADIPVSDSVD